MFTSTQRDRATQTEDRAKKEQSHLAIPVTFLGVGTHGTEDVIPGFRELQNPENPQRIPDPTAQFSHLNMRKENPPPTPTHGDGDFLKMI